MRAARRRAARMVCRSWVGQNRNPAPPLRLLLSCLSEILVVDLIRTALSVMTSSTALRVYSLAARNFRYSPDFT